MGWYEATNAHAFSQRVLQATKTWQFPVNDDKVSTFNSFTSFLLEGWEGLKAYTCTFEKRQSKGAHFEKNCFIFYFTTLRTVQHSLHTSNLLPTPMHYQHNQLYQQRDTNTKARKSYQDKLKIDGMRKHHTEMDTITEREEDFSNDNKLFQC